MVDFRNPEECCGFGGLFSVKFPHISVAMAEDKIARLKESGAEVLISADCGCLMQLGGVMHRQGLNIATGTSPKSSRPANHVGSGVRPVCLTRRRLRARDQADMCTKRPGAGSITS